VSSFDASVAETRSTLPKFFMESPNWLEHIREPLKTLSLCSNTEAQSRVGQRLRPAKPAASAIVAREYEAIHRYQQQPLISARLDRGGEAIC
jgi:hypothetical protein